MQHFDCVSVAGQTSVHEIGTKILVKALHIIRTCISYQATMSEPLNVRAPGCKSVWTQELLEGRTLGHNNL